MSIGSCVSLHDWVSGVIDLQHRLIRRDKDQADPSGACCRAACVAEVSHIHDLLLLVLCIVVLYVKSDKQKLVLIRLGPRIRIQRHHSHHMHRVRVQTDVVPVG